MNNTQSPLMTVEELSEFIHMPVATIYSKKCRGEFPKGSVVKLNKKLLFKRKEIEQWIEDSTESPFINC